ncbi:MAG: serine/threonine-protein kinase, partial [Planctomycetota bacterium]
MGTSEIEGELLEGRYRVRRRLGAGGMATVYLAWDERVEREVAIKVPDRSLLEDEGFRLRFEREIRSLTGLRHPHIVTVLDVGTFEGVPYAVLEYLEGGSLSDRFPDRGHPVAPATLPPWLATIAGALDHVHQSGVIHRDVKPSNILFNALGDAFLADFGISKALEGADRTITQSGMYPGSPGYMPPEIITGALGPAYDQYSLAAVVLRALTGETPEPLRAHLGAAEVLGPLLPAPSAAAVVRALSVEPDDRFPTCRAFAAAFGEGLSTAPAPGPAPPIARTVFESGHAARYVVLGGSGSGRTSLLSRSGARVGTKTGTGEWWLSGRAAFLDTTGEAVRRADLDSSLASLGPERSLTGVFVTVSADMLLTARDEDLEEAARELGESIRAVSPRLGASRPVHLVVTKCDLVAGFEEFFGPLEPERRGELFGWTKASGAPPDRSSFDRSFDRVVKRLFSMRPWAVSSCEAEELARAFLFPHEFACLKSPLGALLGALVQRLGGAEAATLRGVYFVSAKQGGVPRAKDYEALTRDLGLGDAKEDLAEERSPEGSTTYFLEELLAGPTDLGGSRREPVRRSRIPALATLAVTAAVLVALTLTYGVSRRRLAEAVVAVPVAAAPLETAEGL